MAYPVIVKISPYMMEFLKRHREFSDLESMETDENVIEIPSYKKARLDKLKEGMQNITCQSYLLTDKQYEMFQEKKELLLTDMEKEFDVKGNLYSSMAKISVIFHVNQQTSISCVVSNHPEDIPVDSLITIDCNQQTSDCREIMHDRKEDYRLLEYESWNIPMNHHIGIHLTDHSKDTYRWSAIFENCLEKVFKNDSISRTIGISLPNNVYVDLKKFSESIFMVFQNLLWNHERPIYILVFAGSEIMKDKIDEHLKKISDSKAAGGLRSQEISSGIVNNQFTVDVIEGLITELKVDVIVSSVDHTLDLKRGKLSSAILNKAGTQIQDQCDRHHQGGLSFPKIAITNNYGLPTKYVFFGAIPINNRPNTNISTFIEKCLEKAAESNITSIAFPALGTGNLNYEPSEVAAQMESAIAKFKAYPRQTSLKKILIVIYPEGTKGKDTLSKFKDTFAKSKDSPGTISKTRQKPSHKNEWISPRKYDYNHLQWVQFLNYSGKRERLDQAVHHFEKCLSNPSEILTNYPNRYSQVNEENSDSVRSDFDAFSDYSNISISQSEIKEILLFYDLPSQIKTTVEEQFESNLIQNAVFVPGSYADKFKEYLNELRTLNHNNTLHVPSDIESWKLQDSVKEICQQFSPIKCAISSNEKQVLFKDRNFENIQAAKYQLEIFLDLRETVSVSQDRFNFSETNSIFSSDYKSEEFKDDAQKDPTTFPKQEDRSVSPTVPLQHKPVFKSMYETVPLQHKPVFKSMYETVPLQHKPVFKSMYETVPLQHKPVFKSMYETVPLQHKPVFKSMYETVPLQHKPVFKSMYETVPLQHKPVFKSMYETVPSDHKPEFKSVSPTVPSYKKTEESINEFSNISHQQKRISTITFNSQNKKNIQDTDCFTIEDGFTVKIYQGNILTAHVDGIVNAANKYLMHGAGLARAIIKAAGDVVHTEGQAKLQDRKLNDGDVLSTSAGNLTRYSCIIHAVGPMRSSTNTDEYCRIKVAETVCNSLEEASRLGLSSVALPAISSDISPVPMHICTDGYFNGVMEFCRRKPASSPLKEVHFVDLNQTTCDAIKNHFAQKLGNF